MKFCQTAQSRGGLMLGERPLYCSSVWIFVASEASAWGVKLISTKGRIPAAMIAS